MSGARCEPEVPVEEDREDEYSGGDALNHINSFQIYKLDCVISIHNYYGFDVQNSSFSSAAT